MKSFHLLSCPACAITLIATVNGCAGAAAFNGQIRIMSNADIVVVRANAHRKADGILIYGDVRRADGYAGKVKGYLHIVGLDGHGKAVAAIDAPWGEFMSRRFRLAYFKAILKLVDQSPVKAISIEAVTTSSPRAQ